MVFLINHELWGSNPAGYHVFLLLLHLANVALVYLLIRKLATASPMAAMFGAATFALHPTRVESIAWLSGITDPLTIFFLLGALLAHRAFIENAGRWRYFTLSLLCLQMALWSKEVAIIFPLIVVVHDYIYRKKINWTTILAYTFMVVAYLVIRSKILGTIGNVDALNMPSFSMILNFVLGYSELLVFPVEIPFYMQLPEHPISSTLRWISAIAIIALAGFCWKVFNQSRKNGLAFSAIWFILFFWPAILILLYMEGFAARLLYVPAVGVAIFTAILYDHISEEYQSMKHYVMSSFALLVCLYGTLTWYEIPAWQDDGAFYGRVTEVLPESPAGYNGLGSFYMKREDYVSAEKNYLLSSQKAKTNPDRSKSFLALGTIYGITNKLELSERYLKAALIIDPNNSEALVGLGNLAWMNNQFTEAISHYEKAIAARAGNLEAASNLAMAYEKLGEFERAESIRRNIR